MKNSPTFFDWLFQINSLKKEEKKTFLSLMEAEFLTYGFKKVTKIFNNERKYSKAVRFERMRAELVGEWIEIVFDKYGGRKFYIHLGATELLPSKKHIQLGAVVRSKRQLQSWFGSKWNSVFRVWAWIKSCRRVQKYIPQMIAYLDQVEIGKNIVDHDIKLSPKMKANCCQRDG